MIFFAACSSSIIIIIVPIMMVISSSSTHPVTPTTMYAVDTVVFEGGSEVHVAVCISKVEQKS